MMTPVVETLTDGKLSNIFKPQVTASTAFWYNYNFPTQGAIIYIQEMELFSPACPMTSSPNWSIFATNNAFFLTISEAPLYPSDQLGYCATSIRKMESTKFDNNIILH